MDTTDRECQTGLGGTTVDETCQLLIDAGSNTKWGRRDKTRQDMEDQETTYDCALLEPLALPPDLPPPVILIDLGVWEE